MANLSENRIKIRRPASPYVKQKKIESKTRRRRLLLMVLFVLLTLGLTLAMIRLVLRSTSPRPELYIVREGTITNQIHSPMLIIRDEQSLRTPATGILTPTYADGDKVPKNGIVAEITTNEGRDAWEALHEIEFRLSSRQLDLLYEDDFSEADSSFQFTDQRLKPLARQLQQMEGNSIYEAQRLAQQMDILIRERNKNLLSIRSDDEALARILDELQLAQERLAPYQTEVRSAESGIISYHVDNLSARYQVEDFHSMSAKELENLMSTVETQNQDMVQMVRSGQEYGILLNAMYQYFAYSIEGYQALDFPLNRNYAIELSDLGLLLDNLDLVRAEDSDGKVVLLFRTSSQLERLISSRLLNSVILMQSDRGLRVPNEALRFNDDTKPRRAQIKIVRSGYVYEEDVDVLRQDDEYAIVVSPVGAEIEVGVGSVIIINPDAVEEGEQLGT